MKISLFIRKFAHINWALADQAIISGTNFLMGIFLARYLGLEGFGTFTLAWMSVVFIQTMQYSIVSAPMMSIGPKQAEADKPAYFGAVLLQQLIISLLGSLLLLLGVLLSVRFFPEWKLEALRWPIMIASLAFPLQDFFRRYFFTRDKYAVAFVGDALSYLGQICLLFLLVFTDNLSVSNALWIVALSSTVAVIYDTFHMQGLIFESDIFYTTGKRHWNFSKWFITATLSEWLYSNIFIIAAGKALGVSAVGALKAAQNIVAVTHLLFKTLETIIPIKASQQYKRGGLIALNQYLKKITSLSAVPLLLLLALTFLFPSFWLNLVYGPEYINMDYVLRWYAVIYIMMFLWLPFRWGLQTLECTKDILIANIIAIVFAVTSANALPNYFGLMGTLIGILTIHIILFVTLGLTYKHVNKRLLTPPDETAD